MPKTSTPLKGDQIPLFDFSDYEAHELIGSHSDQFEDKKTRAKGRVKDFTWGQYDKDWIGKPVLPMDYAPMNHRGLRGGMASRDLTGIYVGPAWGQLRHSPLAGPIDFPFRTRAAAISDKRVGEIKKYVDAWTEWWEKGQHLPECQREMESIVNELDRWKGVTLLHLCRPLLPETELEEGLPCPTTLIIKTIEAMMDEEF